MTLLLLFAFLAGLLDAIVGGGGLIQLPALLVVRHSDPIGSLLGTNKVASLAGVLVASWTYLQRIDVNRVRLTSAAALAASGAILGAWAIRWIPPQTFRLVALVLIVVVGVVVAWRGDFGLDAGSGKARAGAWLFICALIGVYDGLFGPGTGTFLIFTTVWLLNLDFVASSAHAKAINAATNLAAVAIFLFRGEILWELALPMAICNMAGSLIGARLALARGSRFVRAVYLAIVTALAIRLAFDVFS